MTNRIILAYDTSLSIGLCTVFLGGAAIGRKTLHPSAIAPHVGVYLPMFFFVLGAYIL